MEGECVQYSVGFIGERGKKEQKQTLGALMPGAHKGIETARNSKALLRGHSANARLGQKTNVPFREERGPGFRHFSLSH